MKLYKSHCLVCNKEIINKHKRMFCSWECHKKSPRMIEYWKGSGKRLGTSNVGRDAWNKGIPRPDSVKIAVSVANKGRLINEKNPNWKGDDVSYIALHTWVSRHFGKPKYCEICKKTDEKKYDWASKNGDYSRDRNYWIRLCDKCHKEYDKTIKKHGKIRTSDKRFTRR